MRNEQMGQIIRAGMVTWLAAAIHFGVTADTAVAQSQNFKRTFGNRQYEHYIQLYDENDQLIDPTSADAKPYSPLNTCKKCHDYKAIAHGYHFNAFDKSRLDGKPVDHGRPGEPWLLTDERTGTQIPLSYRGWQGTYHPDALGIDRLRFMLEFGTHLPGGGPGERGPLLPKEEKKENDAADSTDTTDADAASPRSRFDVVGNLDIDCMFCHSKGSNYSHEKWAKNIGKQNFKWVATEAMGLAVIEGAAQYLPDDYDSKNPEDPNASKVPKTFYKTAKFDKNNYTFFDVTRKPSNNACYACHSFRPAGPDVTPKWTHDQDVHLKAGMSCVDCHRNGIDHHTVRGYEGEVHPTGIKVETLSCRGCHMDQHDEEGNLLDVGGRIGSPKPLHKGIPPLHFDKMSCTSCHSGPSPKESAQWVQTAMAHKFGIPDQTRTDTDIPGIVQPVFMDVAQPAGEDGKAGEPVIYPHRMVWPAFWGWMKDDAITPIDPNEAHAALRRALRIRSNFTDEIHKVRLKDDQLEAILGEGGADKKEEDLTDDEKAKLLGARLAIGLDALQGKQEDDATIAVYVSGGKVYRLNEAGDNVTVIEDHSAAQPYAWPIGHNVRPGRQSLGVKGCFECHKADAPIFYGTTNAVGPLDDHAPVQHAMHEYIDEDPELLALWEQSFEGRGLFKYMGFTVLGIVSLIVLLYLLLGLNGLLKLGGKKG